MKIPLAILWNSFILATIGQLPIYLFIMLPVRFLLNEQFYSLYKNIFIDIKSVLMTLPVTCFLAVTLISLLSATPLGTFLFRISLALRKPSIREMNRINPLLEEIMRSVKTKYQKNYSYKILVADDLTVNSAVIGSNILIITTGTLKTLSDEELQSILAHKTGHIFYGEPLRSSLILGADFCGDLAIKCYTLVIKFLALIGELIATPPILGLFFNAYSFILSLLLWPINLIKLIHCLLYKWMMRKAEYKADQFTVNLGFGSGLINFLTKEADIEIRKHGFWNKYTASNPPTELRLDKIELQMINTL